MRETHLKAMMQAQNANPAECGEGEDWQSMWVVDPGNMATAEPLPSFRLEPSEYIQILPGGRAFGTRSLPLTSPCLEVMFFQEVGG